MNARICQMSKLFGKFFYDVLEKNNKDFQSYCKALKIMILFHLYNSPLGRTFSFGFPRMRGGEANDNYRSSYFDTCYYSSTVLYR